MQQTHGDQQQEGSQQLQKFYIHSLNQVIARPIWHMTKKSHNTKTGNAVIPDRRGNSFHRDHHNSSRSPSIHIEQSFSMKAATMASATTHYQINWATGQDPTAATNLMVGATAWLRPFPSKVGASVPGVLDQHQQEEPTEACGPPCAKCRQWRSSLRAVRRRPPKRKTTMVEVTRAFKRPK